MMMIIQQKENARLVQARSPCGVNKRNEVIAEVQNESLDQNGIMSVPVIELPVLSIPSLPRCSTQAFSLAIIVVPSHSHSSPQGWLVVAMVGEPYPNCSY